MCCGNVATCWALIVAVSSWCLVNNSSSLGEWQVILNRVEQDMKTTMNVELL